MPLQQHSRTALTLLARTADGRSLAADVRAIVSSLNPNLPVLDAQSLERQQDGPVETQLRIGAAVAGSVGIVGLLLAAIGIYGVTASPLRSVTRIGYVCRWGTGNRHPWCVGGYRIGS